MPAIAVVRQIEQQLQEAGLIQGRGGSDAVAVMPQTYQAGSDTSYRELADVRPLAAGYRRCMQVVKQCLHFVYDVSPESVAVEAQRDLRRSVRSVDLHTCAVSDTALSAFFESFGELDGVVSIEPPMMSST